MDENRNPEEIVLLHNTLNKMKKKSGAWDSNYGPDKEIEAIVNRDVEETSPLSSSNGLNIRNRKLSESASVPKHVQKAGPPNHFDFKPKHFHSGYRNDRRNFKEFDKRSKDNTRRPDRKEWGTPNGKINGYHIGDTVTKPIRDGAGPDHGSAQWRWKGRRNSRDSIGSLEDKSRSPVNGKETSPKQELDKPRVSSSAADPGRSSHSSNAKPSGRYSSPASHGVKNEGEGLRKNHDGKSSAVKKPEERPKPKVCSTVVADDSWSLFKPPPVFPVDNSSAKIVPKISYASKVKENLNKAPIESVLSHPGKPVQVPASAVKTIASNGLPNGIICNSSEGRLSTASSPAPPIVEQPQPHFHAPPPELVLVSERVSVTENGPSPSSLQSSHLESSLPPPGQQNLGAIFQNEWGLSFINDPGADAEKTRDTSRTEGIVDSFPSALGTDVPLWPVRESEIHGGANSSLGNLPVDSGNHASPGFCTATVKDTEALNINHDCLDSSSPCNLEAIISYHVKEWEQVWMRHEQDPKRVIFYSECLEQVF